MAREHPPHISILGLGPVGAALGSALAAVRTDYRLVGHDRAPERVRAALAAGAIDDGRWNLIAAVEDADLVVVTEPLGQAVETVAQIAAHVRPGSLVTDTVPAMRPMLRAAAALPPGVAYVSGHPILGGGLADRNVDTDGSGPPASPFAGVVYCVVPAPGADAGAVRVLVDLIAAIGAEPYFIDADEHDALVAAVDQLPQLAGAALARALGFSPSSDDLARLVPRNLWASWLAGGRDGADAAAAALAGRDAVLAWLDALARELTALREHLAAADTAGLGAWLDAADAARARLAPAERDAGGDAAAWRDVGSANPLRGLLLGQRKERRG